jgi:polysaccharide export outer membrane protein
MITLAILRIRRRAGVALALSSSLLMALSSLAWAQPAAQAAQAAQTEYRLGAGDTIRIAVYQNPDLSLETRLSDNGVISYPLLGAVRLGGLTVGDGEKAIVDGLKKGDFVKNPQVTIILMQVRGNQVSVLGQVNRPGRYPLELAQTRLSDVLAMAGGIMPASGSDIVTVLGAREGKPFRKQVDLPTVFGSAQRSDDIVLQGSDVVFVERSPTVYIYGEVQRPGQLRLERDMTLLQGLAAGGGLTLRGTDKGIRVHRRVDGKTQIVEPRMDEPLREGDVIYVRESLF